MKLPMSAGLPGLKMPVRLATAALQLATDLFNTDGSPAAPSKDAAH